MDQITDVLDDRGLSRAILCGVSFGGRIALRFAAARPDRTSALILVSTPGPGWQLKPVHRVYARNPVLLAPLFFAGAPARFRPELAAAFPHWKERLSFSLEQLRLMTALLAFTNGGACGDHGADVVRDCAAVAR
jgi:pimeloyl-ACP methyl ester carboxylesterase